MVVKKLLNVYLEISVKSLLVMPLDNVSIPQNPAQLLMVVILAFVILQTANVFTVIPVMIVIPVR
jgi:hypothetical protein